MAPCAVTHQMDRSNRGPVIDQEIDESSVSQNQVNSIKQLYLIIDSRLSSPGASHLKHLDVYNDSNAGLEQGIALPSMCSSFQGIVDTIAVVWRMLDSKPIDDNKIAIIAC